MTDDELFLTAILNCNRSQLILHPPTLNDDQQKRLDVMRARRKAGEPVQYITGFTEFFGYRFEVGPGVLIPRPETEVLADVLIRKLKSQQKTSYFLLDIGTGSGCLAVTMVKELPNCRAVAIDISADALKFARRNAQINGVEDRIEFIERDVFWFIDETLHRFDAVVSNPPYIPTCAMSFLPMDVKQEPELALEGGADGLHYYRYIIPASRRILKTGGILALEHGDGQGKELKNLVTITPGWEKISSFKDNAGRDRGIMSFKSIER